MPWTPLIPGPFGLSALRADADPNFVWADATGLRDFLRPGEPVPTQVPVIVALKDTPQCMQSFVNELLALGGGSVPPIYAGRPQLRYATALLNASYCRAVMAGTAGSMIERIELQRSVIPQRPRPLGPPAPPTPTANPLTTAGPLLLGVIDTGCAFAHPRLRADGGTHTRVLRVWDQDARPAFTAPGFAGSVPPGLGYGIEAGRALLNQIIASCSGPHGIDEAACYERAAYRALRQRFNHGTAVLDLMAGTLPLGARIAKTPTDAPSWLQRPAENAAAADLVFVQLPRDAVQDSSSAGLARLVLDGLRYIVGCAGPQTERIVINLSDGTSRANHDGTSIVERAMLALVAEQRAEFPNRWFEIVVAAGNSFDEERHAQIDQLVAGSPAAVRLRLPPGSESPTALTLVLPAGANDVELRITPPDTTGAWLGAGTATGWPSAARPVCGVIYPAWPSAGNQRLLVTLAPTASFDPAAPLAPAGDWEIELRSAAGVTTPLHLFISRHQPNPGAMRRAQQARFVDVNGAYDPQRHCRELEQDPSPPGSPIRRAGSLNGLATAPMGQGVYTAGAYRWQDRANSRYSSAGPAVAAGATTRTGPDSYGCADIARSAAGVPVASTFGGGTVRVVGTSFAAPQLARALMNRATAATPPGPEAPLLPGEPPRTRLLIDP